MTTPTMTDPEKPLHDDAEEDDAAQEPDGLNEEDRKALAELVMLCMKEERTARRKEVRKAWKLRAFKDGDQHIWYDDKTHCFMSPSASGMDLPRFMDVYNITMPHWRSFVANLSQNPTGVNFAPDDLQKPNDQTASAYAEKMRNRVDRLVEMKERQAEAAGYFCTDGRVVTWSRIDGKGKLRCTMHGVLETKVPRYVRRMESWGYAILSEEIDLYEAQDDYDDDDIESAEGDAEARYEQLARMNVIGDGTSSSEGLKHLTTRHVAWIRPSRYRKAKDGLKKKLKAQFAKGVRVTMCGGKVVEELEQAMEDALRVDWPSPGQGQSRPALLSDLVPIQEAYNDYKNNLRDSSGYVNAATWIDSSTVDPEALPEQRSEPGAIHPIDTGGRAISDCVFQEEPTQMSAQLAAACDQLLKDGEFITGDLPAVYGGDTEGQDTVGVNKLLAVSAKGQMTMAWAGLQRLFAGTYKILIVLAATMVKDDGPIAVHGRDGDDSFDPKAILEGEWGCYPDPESSFPESTADKRVSLQSTLSQLGSAGDKGAALVMAPDNLALVKQYSGLKDLYIPGADARDKQLREIQQLLKEAPVPPPGAMQIPANMEAMQKWSAMAMEAEAKKLPAPPKPPLVDAQGQPLAMVSSVAIGKRDYHADELAKCVEWLSSRACYEETQKGNVLGIQNVSLHADLHEAAIAQAAQANAAKPVPMSITGNFKDLDPATQVQVLQRDGYQPDAASYQTSEAQEQQGKAADTQETAANAQHKAVLAAREAGVPKVQPAAVQRPVPPAAGVLQ